MRVDVQHTDELGRHAPENTFAVIRTPVAAVVLRRVRGASFSPSAAALKEASPLPFPGTFF